MSSYVSLRNIFIPLILRKDLLCFLSIHGSKFRDKLTWCATLSLYCVFAFRQCSLLIWWKKDVEHSRSVFINNHFQSCTLQHQFWKVWAVLLVQWSPKLKRNDWVNTDDNYIIEPRHEKTCLCHMRTTKAQISLRIRAVWSAPLLFAA